MNPAPNKRILLVQLFSNGDCLYATAIARQIKKDFPGASLTWAVAQFCKSILDGNPFVDEIIEITDVPKNDLRAFRAVKKRFEEEKRRGVWDEVFVTQNMDENLAYYDGCIRSCVIHAYPNPVTVDLKPVLRLNNNELEKAAVFAQVHELENYRYRVLFEFAPQSGQLPITKEVAIRIAEKLLQHPDVVVILSSAIRVIHDDKRIVDGSALTLRETAALTPYCTHLLGCSSGISWISTADGATQLPMIQLIDPGTIWVNPLSRDFKRFNIPSAGVIDLLQINEDVIVECAQLALHDFDAAREKYNQAIPLQFKTTENIVYNFICRLQFGCIVTHLKVNRRAFGDHPGLYMAILRAFVFFPFTLIRNRLRKRRLG